MFKIYDGREQFYQWDLEQKLIVSDPTINEVHFSHQVDSEALVCEVYELDGKRVVNVPNILLQEDWKINVYAYCSNYTKVSACFKVIPKAKPADYIYTETEVKTYDEVINKVKGLPLFDLTEDAGLQNMKAGIYTAKPASGTTVKVQLGEGGATVSLREGATFIVGGDTTIKTHSSISYQPFKKSYLAVGFQTTNSANFVRSGELSCKFVLDPEAEGGSYYEYEIKQGNLLTTDDRVMNIDAENTTISNIPSVKAVKDYVNNHGGVRQLPGDEDAFINGLESGIYAFDGESTGHTFWFDDLCETGMVQGIVIINNNNNECYEWFMVGLDHNYTTCSSKGVSALDEVEGEQYLVSDSYGEVENAANKVSGFKQPNGWTYPTTKAVVDYLNDFKEREIDYTKIYRLPRKQLEESYFTNFANDKFFEFDHEYLPWAMNNDRGHKLKFTFKIRVARSVYRTFDNTLSTTYTLKENNPFVVELIGNIPYIKNIDEFIDAGLVVDGDITYLKPTLEGMLNDYAENLVDIANITSTITQISETTNNVLFFVSLIHQIEFWIPDSYEGLGEAIYGELLDGITYYNKEFVLKVKNIPEIEEVSSTVREDL